MAISQKKTTVKPQSKNTKPLAPVRIQFHRWLLAALLTITFYLVTALVAALYIKEEGGLTPEAGFLVTTLFSLSLAGALWWLIESARWAIIHIDQRAARKAPAAKKATPKKK